MQTESSQPLQDAPLTPGEISFNRYLRYDQIEEYLSHLSTSHKNVVEVVHFGQSVQQRNLTYVKISTRRYFKKPLIFIDAGIHAREWIGTAQALYIINQLVENSQNRWMITDVDWIIVPLVNPDGYEYTHTEDRLWRKNRAIGPDGLGVDLNRNFDIHWLSTGASDKWSSNFYAGQFPFSEPESRALSNLILKNANTMKLYISFHAAAQAILYPWGYTTDTPKNGEELHDLATMVANAIYKVDSTEYRVGSFANSMYLGSGTSCDWAYSVANIPLAFTIELKKSDNKYRRNRFDIPHKDILNAVNEMFQGIKVFPIYVQRKYGSFFSKFKRLSLM